MYELKKIEYSFDFLEPVIDERTVEIHHTKHHQNYMNKLNDILGKNNLDMSKPLEKLILDVGMINKEDKLGFLFNIGGVINHDLYFSMFDNKKENIISDELKTNIDKSFGSFDNFKSDFIKEASSFMGSGWTFLVLNKEKELEIISLPNQESPISLGLQPIMVIDVWEHAYYLKYQNLRPKYVEEVFSIINFGVVSKLYDEKKALI